ncbi:MAG TPA: selenium-dependent xanthine dehydrogenase [Candidatus Pelethocola excrementipullorum]|nr:selenium-dependent xanthine dehydrogenase [Candidatus Pelethocola excrementipullorum]
MSSYCKLWINGEEREFEAERKLLEVLREDCHLKSVKDGCSEGACGTCTVLIDGRAQKACTQKVKKMEGAHILTVEGLSQREKDVYVYAFGEAGAVQCGFCIPGMVMCAKGLLDKKPNPARVEIACAIRNNICRCTGYKKIIDGIELAARMLREDIPIEEQEEMIKVGSDFRRIDVEGKVLGTGVYVDDLEIEGMIYGSAVRSKYPRARVLAIHTEKARELPGVVGVFTTKDVPGSNKVGHLKQDWDAMIAEGDITRYLGDAIALVAAETPEILEEAKKLVEVEYEVLKPLTCPEEALKPDAPHLHEGGNILSHEHVVRGNADEVIANSKYKVTRHYETPYTEHAFLEPECAVALPFDGGVFLHTTDQGTYDTQKECSILLGLPKEKVIVENKLVGGGFGGKEDMSVQHHAALIAYLTGRVVKVKLTRAESLIIHPKRHPFSMDMTTACDENGQLTAMKAVVVSDTGAYASLGGPVLQRACTHAAGPYNYQVIDIDGTAVYTNNPPAGAFRGFGVTQTCFATECNITLLAEMVGIDPWEMRYRNAIRPGQVLPNGQIADASTGLVETLEAVKDIYYSNEYVGIGCAMKNAGVGVGIPDYGRVRLIIKDGIVEIHSGASCIGQGVGTVLTQMVAETVGIPYTKISWKNPNTSVAPDSGTTSGSRQTTVTGEAGIRAANKLKEALEGKTLEDLNGQEFYGEFLAKTDPLGSPVPNPVSHVAYGYATQLCILNKDGTVKEMVGAHDVGKVVNPKGAEGQIEGGIIMSLGYALTESYPLKECVPTGKFGTIGLFRADKTPNVKSIIVEKKGLGISYGAIGVGEITSIPTAPAVQGAYYKLQGEFQTSLPLKNTPYEKNRK